MIQEKFSQTFEISKTWRGGPNFLEEPILQRVRIIWSLLLSLYFITFKDPNYSSFIRFQCILLDPRLSFSDLFYKLRWGDLISGGKQLSWKSEFVGPPFCISILKVLKTQILRHSLDFNSFWLIQEYLSQNLKCLQIKEWERNFWEEPILQKVWIIWSPLLYFSFKTLKDRNSLPLIRF